MPTGFLENVKDSEHLEELGIDGGDSIRMDFNEIGLGIDGMTILKRILKKLNGSAWTGFIWLRIGTNGRMCESGNESPGSIMFREFE